MGTFFLLLFLASVSGWGKGVCSCRRLDSICFFLLEGVCGCDGLEGVNGKGVEEFVGDDEGCFVGGLPYVSTGLCNG